MKRAFLAFIISVLSVAGYAGTVPSNEHKNTNEVYMGTNVGDNIASSWYYNSGSGQVRINCSHADTKGSTWSQW